MTQPVILIAAFAFLGFGIKYIDDAFDEGAYSKDRALIVAPFLVAVWIWLSIVDRYSATVLFAILFAVILSGKVDICIFKLSATILIAISIITCLIRPLWPSLFFLMVLGIIDEKGHDYMDAHRKGRLIRFFFVHRCNMKLGLIMLCVCSILPPFYMITLFAFDTAYEATKFLHNHAHLKNIFYHRK